MKARSRALAIVFLVGAACGDADDLSGVRSKGLGPAATSTTFERSPLVAEEGWRTMSPSPLDARAPATSVWTGSELLVWRGQAATTDVCSRAGNGALLCGDPPNNDSAAYDPASDSWRVLPRGPMPATEGTDETILGAWTGSEMVVWGGYDGSGAALNPRTGEWRPIAASPLEPRHGFAMTWTGSEVFIVGGAAADSDGEQVLYGDAAAYDPVVDEWRALPSLDEPRVFPHALATADGVYVIGGSGSGDGPSPSIDLLRPAAEAWESVGTTDGGYAAQYVWTGTAIVMVNGRDDRSSSGAFDPISGTWTAFDDAPIAPPVAASTVWTGREVVVIGTPFMDPSDAAEHVGAALDPTTGRWHVLPPAGFRPRSAAAAAWTGTEVLVWGGAIYTGFTSEPFADGGRYTPSQ